MSLPPCAGIIVIDGDKTVLVSSKNDNYSFPKGKRNKGEDSIDTAWRELIEETGLSKEHVEIIGDFTIDEASNKGNVAIRYFVGKLVKSPMKFNYDMEELNTVEWITVTDAFRLEKFKNRRKDILKQAYEKTIMINDHNETD